MARMVRRSFSVVVVLLLVLGSSVGVAGANELPVLDSGPDVSAPAGTDVVIAGSATDPDGDPLTISWILSAITGDITSCSFTDQSTTTPTLNCGDPGQYLVQISAFDGTDFLDDLGAVITFTEPVNQPPVIDSGPDMSAPVNTDVVLAGSASDPDGDPLTISWQLSAIVGDTTSCTFTGTSTVTPTLNCGTAGQYLAQIEAFDGTDFLDDLGAVVTFTEPIDDLTAPVCTTTPRLGGWIQKVTVSDPESGVAEVAVARTRRAWVLGAPLTLDPAEASVQVTALGTSFWRHGRVELDVTNGDGTTGTCEVTVKGFLAAFF